MTMSSSTDRRSQRYEPIFDVDAVTGVSIEVFWLTPLWKRSAGAVSVGSGTSAGAGSRQGPAHGPFPTSYSAYRDALLQPF
jgi:hypothetical protein